MSESPPAASADRPRRRSGGRAARRRVRVVLQSDAPDCGVACLLMIARALGTPVSSAECRRLLPPSVKGVDAASFNAAARRLGLDARSYAAAGRGAVEQLPMPAVAHWRDRHFVVVEGWSRWRDAVYLVDPAVGRRTVRWGEFLAGFSGVALTFAPGTAAAGRRRPAGWWRRVVDLRREARPRRLAVRLLAAAVACQLLALAVPLVAALVIDRQALAGGGPRLDVLIAAAVVVAAGGIGLAALRSSVLARFAARVDAAMAAEWFPRLLALPAELTGASALDATTATLLVRIRRATAAHVASLPLDAAALLVFPTALLLVAPPAFAVAVAAAALQSVLVAVAWPRIPPRLASGGTRGEPSIRVLELLDVVTAPATGGRGSARGLDLALAAIGSGTPLLVLWIGGQAASGGQTTFGAAVAAAVMTTQLLRPLARASRTIARLRSIPPHLDVLSAGRVAVSA
jgi:ABC-type bacteriocin/lantibiotic exporter with double-glycine peptidase domain